MKNNTVSASLSFALILMLEILLIVCVISPQSSANVISKRSPNIIDGNPVFGFFQPKTINHQRSTNRVVDALHDPISSHDVPFISNYPSQDRKMLTSRQQPIFGHRLATVLVNFTRRVLDVINMFPPLRNRRNQAKPVEEPAPEEPASETQDKVPQAAATEAIINAPDESPNKVEDPLALHLVRKTKKPSTEVSVIDEFATTTDEPGNFVGETGELVGDKESSARFLGGFLSPYSPFNPFQALFTEVQNKDSVLRKMLKLPSVASARLQARGVGPVVGNVEFLERDKKKLKLLAKPEYLVVAAAFSLSAANGFQAGMYQLQVRATQDCAVTNSPALFNPYGVFEGGIITRSLQGTLGADGFVRGSGSFLVPSTTVSVSPSRDVSSIGRTLVLVDPNGLPACGIIFSL